MAPISRTDVRVSDLIANALQRFFLLFFPSSYSLNGSDETRSSNGPIGHPSFGTCIIVVYSFSSGVEGPNYQLVLILTGT